nr:GntR family transcriptional regulator [uncultured Oscillibacter sp.]
MGKRGLKNVAYDYLLEAITTYKLKPGDAIVEQDLSDKLGISRTPIREALKKLESEGLLHHFPSRGTFVASLSIQDVEEIFQLRELFELTALRNAIVQITDEELDRLEEQINALDERDATKPYVQNSFYRSDLELHMLIMKYSGNSRMVRFYKTLDVQFEQLRRISSTTPQRLSKSKQEHLDIIYALRTRDLVDTTRALSLHLQNIKENTKNVCRTLSTQQY